MEPGAPPAQRAVGKQLSREWLERQRAQPHILSLLDTDARPQPADAPLVDGAALRTQCFVADSALDLLL